MSAADADLLISTFEEEKARALGRTKRRDAGLFYTPPEVADQVVALALQHGGGGRVLDPCAGAGAFLVAAARAGLEDLHGIDLDPAALSVARKALQACGAKASLKCADSLRFTPPPADLIIGNPPYGHVERAAERAELLRAFPALRGGEIDRYTAFLLRSLDLVRPGGTVALLIPDTWMFLSRGGPLREAILERSHVAAIVDLGKPFASAKDTRVHALVCRKTGTPYRTFVGRGREALSPVSRDELFATAKRGWVVYRTAAERALCEAMEAASVPLGSVCEVGYGLRTGDNARHVVREHGAIELLGGEDIVPYGLRWRPKSLVDAHRLMPLVDKQRGRRRIAVQRIRTNAQAPWAKWLEAAPVPAQFVCLDSLSTLACEGDLLDALLALISSVPMNRLHRLRTTDVNVKPSALRELPVPRALVAAPLELARLARRRCEGEPVDRLIDAAVYDLFGLRRELVEACERGFWGDRYLEEFQRLEGSMSDPPGKVARTKGTA